MSFARKARSLIERVTGLRVTHPGFYSPLVDKSLADSLPGSFWNPSPDSLGIDFRLDEQRLLLAECSDFLKAYDYPVQGPSDVELTGFYDGNSQFSYLDSRMLFAMLRLRRPRRIIEVGSGYSTLLINDVNRRFLSDACAVTVIDPYPRPFLRRLAEGGVELLQKPVQDADLLVFDNLQAGDILFIDSSHVAKTGSDVNHLIFHVLPRLASGVKIHFHDVFLPLEYPATWVSEGRSWNEQYLVRSVLLFGSHTYRVLFGSACAATHLQDALDVATGVVGLSGGSFWIEKT